MPLEIRSESGVFLKHDIQNIMAGLQMANENYAEPFDALRRALGIPIVGVTVVTDWPQPKYKNIGGRDG